MKRKEITDCQNAGFWTKKSYFLLDRNIKEMYIPT